jgi:hypothetical protein
MALIASAGYILFSLGSISLAKIAFNEDPMMADQIGF